jgi:spermidine synthase
MVPWELLDEAKIPDEKETLTLRRRGEEYVIRLGTQDLMNSRLHFSEEELARLVCERLGENPRILIGGLGMGFTLRSALQHSKGQAEISVSELIPAVVEWNVKFLGYLADYPLKDARVRLLSGDVFASIKSSPGYYHGILLDVDNGPSGFTTKSNDSLYSKDGLRFVYNALRPGGCLGVWSSDQDNRFKERLVRTGFQVEEHRVNAREGKKGSRHTIWTATRAGN